MHPSIEVGYESVKQVDITQFHEAGKMNLYLVFAVIFVVAWAGLAFVLQIASGWIHLPLIAATLLLVRAIADADGIDEPPKPPSSKR